MCKDMTIFESLVNAPKIPGGFFLAYKCLGPQHPALYVRGFPVNTASLILFDVPSVNFYSKDWFC